MENNARQGRYARRVKLIILTRIGFMITVLKNGLRRGKCARMSCVLFQGRIKGVNKMSSTEIYVFRKDGYAEKYARVHNSWRGAYTIWTMLETKYLPSYRPDYDPELKHAPRGYWSRFDVVSYNEKVRQKALKEVWDLANEGSPLTENERIVLISTMDWVICKIDDLPKLIKAYGNFGGDTSLPEQASIFEKILNEKDVIAVGINQTSVSAGWDYRGEEQDPENHEVKLPYNILKENKHFYLFEDDE